MPSAYTMQGIAAAANVVPANIKIFRALMSVESMSHGFDSNGRPTMLVEPHIIWRYATAPQREELQPLKLAYPRAGTYPYGTYAEQPEKFLKICEVDKNLAVFGTSFGLMQVLGENYHLCGCTSPADFYNDMCLSEDEQLMLAARMMEGLHMAPYMGSSPNFSQIALKWNGAGNTQRYAAKLENAYHHS